MVAASGHHHYQQPIVTNQEVKPAEIKELNRNDKGQAYKNVLLRNYIDRILEKNDKLKITSGVSIVDLQTGQQLVGENEDKQQLAANLNRGPVAALLVSDLRNGTLDMNQMISWTPSDVRPGKGMYDATGAPTQAKLQDLLYDLLNRQGNTAVRVFVNMELGGADNVNMRIKDELHLKNTWLQPLSGGRFFLGNTTPSDSIAAFKKIIDGNDNYSVFAKNALNTDRFSDFGVRSQLAGNDYITLVNEISALNQANGNVRHDVGVIYNTKKHKSYAYSFMTTAPGEEWSTPTAQAGASLADMGESLLRVAGDKANDKQMQPETLAPPQAEQNIKY